MALRDTQHSRFSEDPIISHPTPVNGKLKRKTCNLNTQLLKDSRLISSSIISYMTKQSMPAVTLLDKDTIEDFKTADKVVVIAFFDATDKRSNETFNKAAEDLRDSFLFGATSDPELAKKESVGQPGLVLYKSFDEGKNIFGGKFEQDKIEEFIGTASIPLIGEVGPETYAGYMAVSTSKSAPARSQGIVVDNATRLAFPLPTSSPKPPKTVNPSRQRSSLLPKSTKVPSTSQPLTPNHSANTLAISISRLANGLLLPSKRRSRTRNSPSYRRTRSLMRRLLASLLTTSLQEM